jgi:hypothetical protein
VADFPEWGQPPKARGRTRLALAMRSAALRESKSSASTGSTKSIGTTKVSSTKIMSKLREKYGLDSSLCQSADSIHCVNSRLPFGNTHPSMRPDIAAPGPGNYSVEKGRRYLENAPGVKISAGPRMEKATSRYYSAAHCEQSQKLMHSPGPIYAIASDFTQKPLPKRAKRIKKRQASHQQRAIGMKGGKMPGSHIRAWQPESKLNQLYPYTNASAMDNRSVQDCYPDQHSALDMTDSMSRKSWARAHKHAPINSWAAPDKVTMRPSQVWGSIEARPGWDVGTLPTRELSLSQSRAPFFSKNSMSENLM